MNNRPIDFHAVAVVDLEREQSFANIGGYVRHNVARQIADAILKDDRFFTVQVESLPGFPGAPKMEIVRCDCRVLCDIDFARLVAHIRREVEQGRPVVSYPTDEELNR